MSRLRALLKRFAAIFSKTRRDAQFDEELRAHFEMLVEENIDRGLPPEEARRQARIALGGHDQIKEAVRDRRGLPFLESVAADVRFAWHMLRKTPGFTAVALITLALGIGANTAVFTLIDATSLRTLPIRDPGGLLLLRWQARHRSRRLRGAVMWSGCPGADYKSGTISCAFSYPFFDEIQSEGNVLSAAAGFLAPMAFHLAGNKSVDSVENQFVTGEFFGLLGMRPAIGRLIEPSDEASGAAPVVVLSYSYWKTRFDAQPSAIGSSVLIEGKPAQIVGVAPPSFSGIDPGVKCDVWMPLAVQPEFADANSMPRDDPNSLSVQIVARTKPHIGIAEAEAATSIAFANSTTVRGGMFNPEDKPRVRWVPIETGLETLRIEFRNPLLLLLAGVGLLLLIACTNVAGLLLARATTRRREMAVRLALGASRRRLIRQLLCESLLLSCAGSLLGIGVAWWGADLLASFVSVNQGGYLQLDARPDIRVLGFTTALAILAGTLFGLAPALRGSRVDLTPALKSGGHGLLGRARGDGKSFTGSALVIAQVAISVMMLIVAGLFVRTAVNLERQRVGFDTQNLLLVSVDPGTLNFSQDQYRQLRDELVPRFGQLPGVTSVTSSLMCPLGCGNGLLDFALPDVPDQPAVSSLYNAVAPDYFQTMHIPMLAGRDFTASDFDAKANPQAIIISRTLAQTLFRSANPLGRIVVDPSFARFVPHEIVGVVADAKLGDPRGKMGPTAYIPEINGGGSFELRTAADPRALISQVNALVTSVDPGAITQIRTQTEVLDRTLYQERLFAWLASVFGVLALALVCIGLYGLLAYEVAQRTAEIGIRRALGAQPSAVLRLFMARGIILAAAGAAIGVSAALGIGRYLRSLLFGVGPTDPATLIWIAALLAIVALAACSIPAYRATRIDPVTAMRCD